MTINLGGVNNREKEILCNKIFHQSNFIEQDTNGENKKKRMIKSTPIPLI